MGDHNAPDETPQPLAWLTPARRARLYAVLVALAPLAVVYGLVSQDQADLWLIVLQAALIGGGGALALAHTPRDKK
ncbi:hypothetical protein TPB0596_12630 [Tsukamurella pulmonis]|uniref:hypothetical protein n=1 Tax=Tsukamurella pulmonis TaxID=47312 RepID=UPI001EDF9A58|nr:hypothetical protein [Tsukamurella pulmonis]BDD81500.1 hypothetical protein TPB0596_12630 [Tsukamurella pulmonis]